MAATSRSGRAQLPALSGGPVRLALEVEDHPPCVNAQELAEVEIAMDPDQETAG